MTEQHLEFLSLKGGCTGSSESTLVKIPHCCKSHVSAHMSLKTILGHINDHFQEFWPLRLQNGPHSLCING